ncbi:MAG: Serine-protein kinase RsbW [Chlamydiae bacterium]|nr:Serine-protein kinase RsbW [Chlamydiota bacterium]
MTSSTRSFPTDLSILPHILSWVRKQVEDTPLDFSDKMRIELALEEAVVNMIQHGTAKKFTLICRHKPNREIEFELSDQGDSFNPLTHPERQNKDLPIEEIEVGGVGLPLMKKCMDALFYRREGEKNILTMVKNI